MHTYNIDQGGEQAAASHAPRLECSGCGAEVDAACMCGVAYVPAGARAAAAIAENPEKSDRVIADEIGVSDRTVNRARRTATGVAVGKRIGKDGRVRGLPSRLTNSAPATGQIIPLDTGKVAPPYPSPPTLNPPTIPSSGHVNGSNGSDVAVNTAPARSLRISKQQKAADRFESAIGHLANTCELYGDADLTPPDAEMAAWAIEKLDEAIRSLTILKTRMLNSVVLAHAITGAMQ